MNKTAIAVLLGGLLTIGGVALAKRPKVVMWPMILEFEGLSDEEYGKIVDQLSKSGVVHNWNLGDGLVVDWTPESVQAYNHVMFVWGGPMPDGDIGLFPGGPLKRYYDKK